MINSKGYFHNLTKEEFEKRIDDFSPKDGYLASMIKTGYFVPSTPILLNHKHQNENVNAFSCYLQKVGDSIISIADTVSDSIKLSASGGGIGVDWSAVRGTGLPIRNKGTSAGTLPLIKWQSVGINSCSQAGIRKGSMAAFLDVDHPDIDEFLEMRNVKGGDESRKCANVHIGVNISDDFMNRVFVKKDIKSRNLLFKIVKTRYQEGEPFIYFSDRSPIGHSTNLCTEVILDTKPGVLSVCCLGSFNFDKCMTLTTAECNLLMREASTFMSKVYGHNVKKLKKNLGLNINTDYSIGLGVFGYADYATRVGINLDGESFGEDLLSFMTRLNDTKSVNPHLPTSRYMTAIAPTETIARVFGASPSLDPYPTRKFMQKDSSGSTSITSPHSMTAFEQNQTNKIKRYAELQKVVHQGISCSLFYTNGDMHQMVSDFKLAWELGLKTLYYVKSSPLVLAEDSVTSCSMCVS